jgi:phage recombination protein Bet
MTGTEVEVHDVTGEGALAVRPGQVEWTPVQRAALAQIGVQDASDADLMVFLHYSQRTGLDPFSRQIYMIKRKQEGREVQTIQTGIDGFRIIAHRTKLYRGRQSVEWCGRDGKWRDVWLGGRQNPPHAARVTVLRADFAAPVSAVALYEEFVARKFDGNPNRMWSEKPAHMIAKCAEAAALRTAFPHDLGGLFTDDEMEHLDGPVAGPVLPNTVESEPWPDFLAEAADIEKGAKDDPAAARTALLDVLAKARGLLPNDHALHNAIVEIGQRIAALIPKPPAEQPPPKGARDPRKPRPASGKEKGAIATLMSKGGIAGRVGRLYAAAELAGLEHPLVSFDDLDANAAARILERLREWEKVDPKDFAELTAKLDAILPDEGDPEWEVYDGPGHAEPEPEPEPEQ